MKNKYERPMITVAYVKFEESIAGTSITGSHNINVFEENLIRFETFQDDEQVVLDTHIDSRF